jgi:hypothetical protein
VKEQRETDRTEMENFYYAVIYDVLQGNDPHIAKTQTMRELKAKIIRLNSIYSQRLLVDI